MRSLRKFRSSKHFEQTHEAIAIACTSPGEIGGPLGFLPRMPRSIGSSFCAAVRRSFAPQTSVRSRDSRKRLPIFEEASHPVVPPFTPFFVRSVRVTPFGLSLSPARRGAEAAVHRKEETKEGLKVAALVRDHAAFVFFVMGKLHGNVMH